MAKTGKQEGGLRCSFCGKGQDDVRKLIAGPTVYICDECIELCNDIIAEEWEVTDDGDRMKRIKLRVRYAGRPGPETAAVLFISRDLGFRP